MTCVYDVCVCVCVRARARVCNLDVAVVNHCLGQFHIGWHGLDGLEVQQNFHTAPDASLPLEICQSYDQQTTHWHQPTIIKERGSFVDGDKCEEQFGYYLCPIVVNSQLPAC